MDISVKQNAYLYEKLFKMPAFHTFYEATQPGEEGDRNRVRLFAGSEITDVVGQQQLHYGVNLRDTNSREIPFIEEFMVIDSKRANKAQQSFERPGGNLLNVAHCVLGVRVNADDPSLYGEKYLDFCTLKGLLDDLVESTERITSMQVKILFNAASYRPIQIAKDENVELPFLYLIDSLADAVYFSLCTLEKYYPHGFHLLKCKNCGKLFFSSNKNSSCCYFSNENPELNGKSCKEAFTSRRAREEETVKELDKLLHNIRQRLSARKNSSREKFNDAYRSQKADLKYHPFMYRELLDWVKKYEQHDDYPKKRRRSK